MMKIGLMGFDFNCPNKGCEALSYSFVSMLSEMVNEELELHVFAYADLGEFPRVYPHIKFVWHRLRMKSPVYWNEMRKEMEKCACIFDITYGDGFSDIYGKVWNANTDMAKQIANMTKTPLILLPQTYGPYNNKILKYWAAHIVKKSEIAFSRDKQSADEMFALGCKNVIPTTDLAFALPFDKTKYSLNNDKIKIGFNVSSLLWDGGHNIKLKTDYKEYCRQVIKKYVACKDIEVHLIPHVIDSNNYDSLENDSRICQLLHNEFPTTVLAPDFGNPIEAKSYISNMNVFIGARMHSTIGSLSSEVPTIAFSYSKKFEGLFGNLEYPYVISAMEITTNEAVQRTIQYIENRTELKKNQSASMGKVNKKLDVVRENLEAILMNLQSK